MKIRVILEGDLYRYSPHQERSMEIDPGVDRVSVQKVLRELGIPEEGVGVYCINGHVVGKEAEIGDGDELLIVPAFFGG